MIIKNLENLISHGNISGRKIVLDILEAGLKAADPYDNVKRMIHVQGQKLIVGDRRFLGLPYHGESMSNATIPLVFDLSEVGNIYVVGGGKAAQRMAKGIEDVLGDLITQGQVNAKKGEPAWCKRIQVTFAGHPIPDEDSVEGSIRIKEIEQKAKKGDIVFNLISGGGSALLALPASELTLEEVQDVTRMLLFECGAAITEMNAVRGKLRMPFDERYESDATYITIGTDEAPPAVSYAWSFEGAARRVPSLDPIDVLKRYDLLDKVSQRVRLHLETVRSDPRYQSARPHQKGKLRYSFRAMGPEYMLEGARRRSEELGVNPYILSLSLNDIEASAIAQTLAYIAQEVEYYGRPFKAPCVMLFAGEPTVAVGKASGKGGRNQEFALSTAPRTDGSKNVVIASADSDGTDGPTDAAGGIVDGCTMKRAKEIGVDIYEELRNHNSYDALTKLSDTIFTGAQGTNVRGLALVYIGGCSS